MKNYSCAMCKKRGKHFSGTRREVRLHLREEHRVRGKKKSLDGKKIKSQLTANTIVEEF